ncbi:FCD domain-containing protein [Chelatococcus sp. SYSU_G07232]|uniref:FCD domain-containing protein n=1 Tax=Chelatococcus albus TaxID=3047466 RepID=A0ABT7AMJ3_9HYPH|nr:FCD domain-containing protein [Chelatococcus sp. SYSU_G07232]MDJ1160177.1 FCD domain-containing protein [Chelatococcus sp. SYSU_G07232]
MPFRMIEQQRLYQQVAEQILALIQSGEIKVGDRLPPERDLSKRLGVSRPTVREAMIALELAGIVEVRIGAGTTVVGAPMGDKPLARWLEPAGPGPIELVEARRMLEREVAAVAAAEATAAHLAAIAETLTKMRAAEDTEAHRAADRLFHTRIAEATGNAVVASLVDGLWGEMYSPLFERLGHLSGLIPQGHPRTLAEHEAIYAALAAHDAVAARAAMDAHLVTVASVLSQDEDAPKMTGTTNHERKPVAAD